MRIIVTVYFTFYLLQGNKKEKKLYKIMIDILAKSLRLEIYIRYIFTSFYLMTFTKIVKVLPHFMKFFHILISSRKEKLGNHDERERERGLLQVI